MCGCWVLQHECAAGQVSLEWTRIVIGKIDTYVGAPQFRDSWNAMLVVWNEAGVVASQVLVDWNQLSYGWNVAGVGIA